MLILCNIFYSYIYSFDGFTLHMLFYKGLNGEHTENDVLTSHYVIT